MWSRSQSLFSLCRFLRSEKSKALLAPPTSNRRERRPLFSLISFPSRYVSARDVASSLLCGERERAKGGTASRRKREREMLPPPPPPPPPRASEGDGDCFRLPCSLLFLSLPLFLLAARVRLLQQANKPPPLSPRSDERIPNVLISERAFLEGGTNLFFSFPFRNVRLRTNRTTVFKVF